MASDAKTRAQQKEQQILNSRQSFRSFSSLLLPLSALSKFFRSHRKEQRIIAVIFDYMRLSCADRIRMDTVIGNLVASNCHRCHSDVDRSIFPCLRDLDGEWLCASSPTGHATHLNCGIFISSGSFASSADETRRKFFIRVDLTLISLAGRRVGLSNDP